ncbi:hypothetical protein HanIR_Chr04g0180871 [Helianthus annuus]|nr:hypothetical protein HanIR_Chr04g0180871 [Helianthus annuus]
MAVTEFAIRAPPLAGTVGEICREKLVEPSIQRSHPMSKSSSSPKRRVLQGWMRPAFRKRSWKIRQAHVITKGHV